MEAETCENVLHTSYKPCSFDIERDSHRQCKQSSRLSMSRNLSALLVVDSDYYLKNFGKKAESEGRYIGLTVSPKLWRDPSVMRVVPNSRGQVSLSLSNFVQHTINTEFLLIHDHVLHSRREDAYYVVVRQSEYVLSPLDFSSSRGGRRNQCAGRNGKLF